MRLATYNIEWFTKLFDRENRFDPSPELSRRYNVTKTEQADALGVVFKAMDADAIMIIEAPDASTRRKTVPALENFGAHFGLRTRAAVMGFMNDTQQEIALLFDPDVLSARHVPRAGTCEVPRFDGTFEIDLDVDAVCDKVRFSKPPLELEVTTKTGIQFHMIGAHLKSKAPHGARNPTEAMKLAIANRRKQLAQAIWLRARIDQHLSEATPLIVLGDLNDGPGLDEFEGLFGRSSVEIVMQGLGGTLYDPHAMQATGACSNEGPTSARFWIEDEKRHLSTLLDYIMVSSDLRKEAGNWRIWHPIDDPECAGDPLLRDALLIASDHFPVTVDLKI